MPVPPKTGLPVPPETQVKGPKTRDSAQGTLQFSGKDPVHVTLLFERMAGEPARLSRDAALALLSAAGAHVEFSLWVGLFAPKATPTDIVNKLRAESKKAAGTDVFKKAIDNIGDVVAYLDQPEFAKFWDEDSKRVEAAVQAIGKV